MLNTWQYKFTGTCYMKGIRMEILDIFTDSVYLAVCFVFVFFYHLSEWPRDEAREECTGRH